jgi:hypothetical protein
VLISFLTALFLQAKMDAHFFLYLIINTDIFSLSYIQGTSSKWVSLFNISDHYWRAHQGGDHIIAMPAPVTNLRHESSQRGFFHYMSHLHTPIFLGVEYSASFVREYPVCASQKNIVMPYPTTDPALFSGALHAGFINRSALLYYAGGMHGDCIEVRRAMKFMIQNSTHLPEVLPDVRSVQAEREHGFRAATFCPVPVGDSPSSKRMYDVLNFGCIPVVLSDDLVWAYTRQTGGPLDHTKFAIQMPQSVVQFPAEVLLKRFRRSRKNFGRLPDGTLIYDLLEQSYLAGGAWHHGKYVNPLVQILWKISRENIDTLRAEVEKVAPLFRYYNMNSTMTQIPTSTYKIPDGGAVDMLAQLLSQRKKIGLDKLRDQCQSERRQKGHRYISRYPCDRDKRRRR